MANLVDLSYLEKILEGRVLFAPATKDELNLINKLDKESSNGQVFEVEKTRINRRVKQIDAALLWQLHILRKASVAYEDSHARMLRRLDRKVDLEAVIVKFTGVHPPGDFCGICRQKYEELQDAEPSLIKHSNCSCRGQVYCKECITYSFQHSTLCPFCRGELKGLSAESMLIKDAEHVVRLCAHENQHMEAVARLQLEKKSLIERCEQVSHHQREVASFRAGSGIPPTQFIKNSSPAVEPNFQGALQAFPPSPIVPGAAKQIMEAVSQAFLNTLTILADHCIKEIKPAWDEKNVKQAEEGLRCLLKACKRALELTNPDPTSVGVIDLLNHFHGRAADALASLLSYPDATDIPLTSVGLESTPDKSRVIVAELRGLVQALPPNPVDKRYVSLVEDLYALDRQSRNPKEITSAENLIEVAKFSLLISVRRVSDLLMDRKKEVSTRMTDLLQKLIANNLKTLAVTDWERFLTGRWPRDQIGEFDTAEFILPNERLFEIYRTKHLERRIHEVIWSRGSKMASPPTSMASTSRYITRMLTGTPTGTSFSVLSIDLAERALGAQYGAEVRPFEVVKVPQTLSLSQIVQNYEYDD